MFFALPWALAVWLVPLSAFALCWLTLAALMQRTWRLPMDHPNERSLHVAPTPRVGGIGVIVGLTIATLLIPSLTLWPILVGAIALAGISLLDDYKNLRVSWRLLAHFFITLGCLSLFADMRGGSLLLATLIVVWMTNLYNFMDGADGLAGGMAVIGFAALAIAAGSVAAPQLAVVCAAIAAANLAFLRFNFPPAKLFMGDAGSIPVGFLAASLAVYGVLQDYWAVLFPVIVFSPFILDASVTLIKRGVRGEKIWRAHREHYYQRLVGMGWSHRKLALASYVLMVACALAALLVLRMSEYTALITGGWLATFLLIFIAIDWQWSQIKHEN